jgi:hypothetical protein
MPPWCPSFLRSEALNSEAGSMLYEFILLEERPEARHPLVGRHLACPHRGCLSGLQIQPGARSPDYYLCLFQG